MRARNSHFIEEQLGGVLAALADFVENLAAPESRPVSLDNDQRDARSALARICLGNNDDEVGLLAVGDESLGAGDHVLVTVQEGFCLYALQIGPDRKGVV